jgi:hypothetical protein
MAIFVVDLEVDQGADFSYTTTPWVIAGTPVDFTGATARAMVRRWVDSVDVLASVTDVPNAVGSVVLHGTAGTATYNLSAATTTGFDWSPFRHDLLITLANGLTTKLLSGRMLVGLSVTR